MRPAHCLFLSDIIKRIVCISVAAHVEFCSVVGVRVECRRDLNASGPQLVLERTILKRISFSVCPPYSLVRGWLALVEGRV